MRFAAAIKAGKVDWRLQIGTPFGKGGCSIVQIGKAGGKFGTDQLWWFRDGFVLHEALAHRRAERGAAPSLPNVSSLY